MIYYLLFFGYCVLAAIALPIPVEAGLLGAGTYWNMLLLGGVMGAGKACGGWMVFRLGLRFEGDIRRMRAFRMFNVDKWLKHIARWCEHHGYMTMYVILSIPIMTDTVPLYVFSIMNERGEIFQMKWFVLTNFWAGFTRALLVFILVALGLINL